MSWPRRRPIQQCLPVDEFEVGLRLAPLSFLRKRELLQVVINQTGISGMNALVSVIQKQKKEEVFCQKAAAALNGPHCLSAPSGRSRGLTLLSVFTGPLPFHWPKPRRACMNLTWMTSKPGHIFSFPGLRLYSLGSNNVSTLIFKRGICDLYYTINQCIYSTRSAFYILNFYLAELIITDLLSYRQKPASSSLYILQRTSLLCNLWCEEFLKQSSPAILTVWLFKRN